MLGGLSDRIGRKPLMIAGNLLAIALLYPIYWSMTASTGNAVALTLLVSAQMVPFVILYAPLAAFLVEAFPPNVFLPLIATALVAKTGSPLAWLAYPIGVALISVVVNIAYVRGVSPVFETASGQ